MNQDKLKDHNSQLPVYKIIADELDDVDRKYKELIVRCENVYSQIFKEFGVIEIAFSRSVSYWFHPFQCYQMEVCNLRYFDFEVPGKKLQLYTTKYGYNLIFQDFDYITKLPLLIDSVNDYLSVELPTSEWPKGNKSPLYCDNNREKTKRVDLDLDVTEADFTALKQRRKTLYQEAVSAIKDLMKSNGYRRIFVPKGKVLPAIKEFRFRMDLIEIDPEDDTVLVYHEQNRLYPLTDKIAGVDIYLFPNILRSVYESIEYYKEHPDEIPENCLI